MRYLKFMAAIGTIAIVLSSCKKDADRNTQITYDSYLPLEVGNYWIYEEFRVDTSGNATSQNRFDSTYIEKDTVINSNTYYKISHKGLSLQWTPETMYIRDSLHYLIKHTGEILFSSQNFTDTFSRRYFTQMPDDTVCYITTKMANRATQINVPAGAFNTFAFSNTYYMFPNYSYRGNPRYMYTHYCKDTGIINESLPFYLNDATTYENRLIRYHIN